MCTLAAGALGVCSGLTGCDNDVPTPAWLPNYADSGYGGKGGAGGQGAAAGGGAKAAAAGDAGESSSGGSSGEGGDEP
jgi:hypothetical protein